MDVTHGINNVVTPENITWSTSAARSTLPTITVAQDGLSAVVTGDAELGDYDLSVAAFGDGFLGAIGSQYVDTDFTVGPPWAPCVALPEIGGNPANDAPPVGWGVWSGSPDITAGNGYYPGYSWWYIANISGPSARGGSMSVLVATHDGTFAEGLQTTISGLTAGNEYTLSLEWQQGSAGPHGQAPWLAGGQLMLVVDNNPTAFTSSRGLDDLWQTARVTFTAASSNAIFVARIMSSGSSGTEGGLIVVDDVACFSQQ